MKKFYKKIKEYYDNEERYIAESKKEIDSRNSLVLRSVLLGCVVAFIINIYGVYANQSEHFDVDVTSVLIIYSCLIIFALTMFFILTIKPKLYGSWAIYFSYSFALFFAIYSSGYVSSDFVSVMMLALLMQIPVIFIEKTKRLTFFVILLSIIYAYATSFGKNPVIYADEMLNLVMFLILGLVIGIATRPLMLNSFVVSKKLANIAYIDELTNLFNRRKLYGDLDYYANNHEDYNLTGMIMIDVDFFKSFNDYYGHQKGDDCLNRLAQIILSFRNKNVKFYRYGGEEVIGVFINLEHNEIVKIINELLNKIRDEKIPNEKTEEKIVTVSIGGVGFDKNNSNYDAIISLVDKQLYKAKNNGRNTYEFIVCDKL